ncbi:MAG TPA: preprotein translocase subunit SecG [Actinomycetota bacterium]|nr:preprotein translocase subunit SecG [Actinomycetota bacterium]
MINVLVLIVDVISALFLVVFILLHSGKGGGLSDMFGGGAGLAGGTAVEKRLDKITVATAILFGVCTFWLSWKWH